MPPSKDSPVKAVARIVPVAAAGPFAPIAAGFEAAGPVLRKAGEVGERVMGKLSTVGTKPVFGQRTVETVSWVKHGRRHVRVVERKAEVSGRAAVLTALLAGGAWALETGRLNPSGWGLPSVGGVTSPSSLPWYLKPGFGLIPGL